VYCAQCKKQIKKATLHAVEYIHYGCKNLLLHISMGAIIIQEPSQWLKQFFRNSPLYTAQSHTCTCIKITIKTQEKPSIKWYDVKTIVEVLL